MKVWRLFLEMLAGNAAGGLACWLVYGLSRLGHDNTAIVIFPSLFLVPFTIGLVSAWVWRPLELRVGEAMLHSLSCTVVGLLGAFVAFHEGIVCLLIVSPALYLGIDAGVLAGRSWFRRKDQDGMNFYLAAIAI
ncbi:MAG TPA: hypothetical protein VK961_21155 [Chthoniobacter sp.]|nr:hypothetical protein [Chthoniobacter sp.]